MRHPTGLDFLLTVVLALAPLVAPAATSDLGIERPEGTRHALLFRPDNLTPGKHPLVILLHGHGGSAAGLLAEGSPLSVWRDIARREGWLLIAPDGLSGSDRRTGWNDCRADAANNPVSDDSGFIRALVERAVRELDADPARLYVMGMSNGGMMTYRLAIDLGDRLAAAAVISGAMAARNECADPVRPVPILILAGTADPIVPYRGGDVRTYGQPRGSVIGIADSVGRWLYIDGLAGSSPVVEYLPHRNPADPTRALRKTWGSDPAGLQVRLVRIEGGGHIEPSQRFRADAADTRYTGPQNGDLEAAEEAWRFFRDKQRH